MIVRRASEIIRLALTISQIQNSDALSWKDKTDMLNQSYIRLYDDLNNTGDQYYVAELEFNHLNRINPYTFKLPDDFWKLRLLGFRGIFGELQPIERAPNVGPYYSGYRIANNTLTFNNRWVYPGPVVIRYIPKPQTITYPRPGNRIQLNAIYAAYDALNDVIVTGMPSGITVINNSSGKTVSKEIENIFRLAVSAGVIYIVKNDGIYCYDYELNEVSILENTFDLYVHLIGWEPGVIVKIDGSPMKYISGGTPEISPDYWNYMDGSIVRTETGGVTTFTYTSANDEVQDITSIFQGADSFVIADPFIYLNKGGNVIVYNELEETDMSQAIIG